MPNIYKSSEGARLIREQYLAFLRYWPSPNRQFYVPTRQGDTFVVECGAEGAPPLLLLHGGAMNSSMWIGDVTKWASHFRIYVVDVIGEPGLSAPSRPALNSDAYAAWLDEVMQALSIGRIAIAGHPSSSSYRSGFVQSQTNGRDLSNIAITSSTPSLLESIILRILVLIWVA